MISSVDLHLHTEYSDGTDSASSLIDSLRKYNIITFAVCDHDTVDGCNAIFPLVPKDMQMINGIEFSCTTSFKTCHILGLDIDISNQVLKNTILEGKKLRENKLSTRLGYLKHNHNIVFSDSDIDYLKSLTSVGKPHLARLLVTHGLADSIDEAIQSFLNFKSINDRIDAKTAIDAIKTAGGIPVWAHPLGGESDRKLTESEFFSQLSLLKSLGLEGLECYYSRYNISEIEFLMNVAKNKNLLISGGSDYHGENKNISPGELCSEECNIDTERISVLDEILKV